MATVAGDHYEVLGVTRTATAAEVRAAYFRAIKEHPPEKDPEGFKLLSEAYRTLSNPERRKAYDAEERLPPDAVAERERLQKLAKTDSDAAIKGLRALVKRYPRLRSIRFELGVALDEKERFGEAIPLFRALFEEQPTKAIYATWLGDALRRSGETEEGLELLREAIVLDSRDPSPFTCLARHHTEKGEHAEALRVLDRAIRADGQVDLGDLPLMIQRLYVLAHTMDWKRMREAVREVVALPPAGDPDARRYVAGQLAGVADVFDKASRADLTTEIVEGMLSLDPDNAELRQASENLRKPAQFMRQRHALLENESQPQWIRAFVLALTFDDASEEDKNRILAGVATELSYRASSMRSEWSKARATYPDLLGSLAGPWERLQEVAAGSGTAPKEDGGWIGCLVLAIIIFFVVKGCG